MTAQIPITKAIRQIDKIVMSDPNVRLASVSPRLFNDSGRDVSYQKPLFLPKQVRLEDNELGVGGPCSK